MALSTLEQLSFMQSVDDLGFVKREVFRSAAGIEGNTKVEMVEALVADSELLETSVVELAKLLEGVHLLSGVPSGGTVLGREVARHMDVPFVPLSVEKKRNGHKRFRMRGEYQQDDFTGIRVGLVEDVTSTRHSIRKIALGMRIGSSITAAASVLRRGVAAPEGTTDEEVAAHNRMFPFRPMLEFGVPFPVRSVVELPLPLWIPTEKQKSLWLPPSERSNQQSTEVA